MKVGSNFRGYKVTSPFGPRKDPITGEDAFHTGIDIVTGTWKGDVFERKPGADICAFMDGTVTHAKEGVTGSGYGGFGIVVAMTDMNGCTQMYAHLSRALVRVGDKVKKGQVIGKEGSTGRSTGNHLHYEVRKKGYGTHTDPVEYLEKCDTKIQEMADKQAAKQAASLLQMKREDLDVTFLVNGKPIPDHYAGLPTKGFLKENRAYVPVRPLAELMGWTVTYEPSDKSIALNGSKLKTKVIVTFDNASVGYAQIREIATMLSLDLEWCVEQKFVRITPQ